MDEIRQQHARMARLMGAPNPTARTEKIKPSPAFTSLHQPSPAFTSLHQPIQAFTRPWRPPNHGGTRSCGLPNIRPLDQRWAARRIAFRSSPPAANIIFSLGNSCCRVLLYLEHMRSPAGAWDPRVRKKTARRSPVFPLDERSPWRYPSPVARQPRENLQTCISRTGRPDKSLGVSSLNL
jgi:hypothetical protein